MKNTQPIAFLLLLVLFTSECKKKSSSETTTNNTPPKPTFIYTAKVNGQSWSSSKSLFSTFAVGADYLFLGTDVPDTPYTEIEVGFRPNIGTFVLKKQAPYYCKYYSQDGKWFKSSTGTINIIEVDTSAGVLKRLKATFSFQTDTINSQFYSITEGTVDYTK